MGWSFLVKGLPSALAAGHTILLALSAPGVL